jgi:MFS family permease
MLVAAMNQLAWITFAPITGDAAAFYGVSDFAIGLLSLVFMAVFIVMSFPASWVIDTFGIRVGVGIGAALTGGFALLRGLVPADYTWVLVAQIGLAVGQPFVLNAVTKTAARWFPARERATAAGLGMLAIYLGILLGLVLTPALVASTDLPVTLRVYGIVPPLPPAPRNAHSSWMASGRSCTTGHSSSSSSSSSSGWGRSTRRQLGSRTSSARADSRPLKRDGSAD